MMVSDKRIGPRDLGIKLYERSGRDHFKWLLACQLFGAPISQEIAAKTYKLLDARGYTDPDKLAGAEWQELVNILGEGGYRHYDESTARELISIGKVTQEKYGGSFREFLDRTQDKADIFVGEAKI